MNGDDTKTTRGRGLHRALDTLSRWQRRHALLLFLALGAALFTVDHLRRGERAIELPAVVAGDPASAQQWLEDEVLYREALVRGLDDGDLIVRRRLVQKMRLLLETGVDAGEPDATALREWIDRHPGRYGGVARSSLDHVFLSRGRHGAELDAAAGRIGARLAEAADLAALADPHPAGTRVEDAEPRALERSFGTALAGRIAELPLDQWQGPLPSALGLHFIRVRARATRTPDYAAVHDRARRDYLIEQRRMGTRLALEALLRRHGVGAAQATP